MLLDAEFQSSHNPVSCLLTPTADTLWVFYGQATKAMNFIKGYNSTRFKVRHPVYTEPTKSMYMEDAIFSACKNLAETVFKSPHIRNMSAYSLYQLKQELNQQLSAYRSFDSVHGFKDKAGRLLFGNSGGFSVILLDDGEWFATVSLDSSYCSHVSAGQYISGCIVARDRQGKITAESQITTPSVEGGAFIETVELSDQHVHPALLRQLFPTCTVDSVNGCGFIAMNISTPAVIDGLEIFRLETNGELVKKGRLLRIPGYSIAEEASERANAMLQQALNSPETSIALTDAIQRFGAVQKEISSNNYVKTDSNVDEAIISMLSLKNAAAFFTTGPRISESRQIDIINRTALKAVQSAGVSRFCLEDAQMQQFYLSGLNTLAELHSKNHQILDEDTLRPIGQFDGSRWRSTPMMVTGSTYGEPTPNEKYSLKLGGPSTLQLVGYANMAEDNKTAVEALANERERIEKQIQLFNPKKIASDIESAERLVEEAYNRYSESLVNQGIAVAASKAILEQIAKILAYPVMIGPWARPLGCIGDFLQITDNYRSVTADYNKMCNTVFSGYNTAGSWFCFRTWRTCEGDSSACSTSFWGGGSRQKLVPCTLRTPTRLGERYMRIDRQTLKNMGVPTEYAYWVTNWLSHKQTISQVFKKKTVVANCTYSYWGAKPADILENFRKYITSLLPTLQLVAAAKSVVDAGIENIKTLELARAHAVSVQAEYDVLLTRLGSIKAQQAYYASIEDVDWEQINGVYFDKDDLESTHPLATTLKGAIATKVDLGMQALSIRSALSEEFKEAVDAYRLAREARIKHATEVEELKERITELEKPEASAEDRETLATCKAQLTQLNTQTEKFVKDAAQAIKTLIVAAKTNSFSCDNIKGFKIAAGELTLEPRESLDLGLGRSARDEQFTESPAGNDGGLAVALTRKTLPAQQESSKEWLLTTLTFKHLNFTIPAAIRLEENQVENGEVEQIIADMDELEAGSLLDVILPYKLVVIPLGLEYTTVTSNSDYLITLPGYVLPLTTLIAMIYEIVGSDNLTEEHLASVISCLDRCDAEDLKASLADSPLTERERVVLDAMLDKAYGEDDDAETDGEKAFKAVIASADNLAFLPFLGLDSSLSGYARLWSKIASSVSLSTIVPKYEYQAFNFETKQFEGKKTLVENAAASHTIVRRLACELEN